MTRYYLASEGLRKLSRYLETAADQLGDSLFGDRLRPVYAGVGSLARRNYIEPDRENLGGYVLWAKNGGKLHESGILSVRDMKRGGTVVKVDPKTKPKEMSFKEWLKSSFGLSENEAVKTAKQKR